MKTYEQLLANKFSPKVRQYSDEELISPLGNPILPKRQISKDSKTEEQKVEKTKQTEKSDLETNEKVEKEDSPDDVVTVIPIDDTVLVPTSKKSKKEPKPIILEKDETALVTVKGADSYKMKRSLLDKILGR